MFDVKRLLLFGILLMLVPFTTGTVEINETFTLDVGGTCVDLSSVTTIDHNWTKEASTNGAYMCVSRADDEAFVWVTQFNSYAIYTVDDAPSSADYNITWTAVDAPISDDLFITLFRFQNTTDTYYVAYTTDNVYTEMIKVSGGTRTILDSTPTNGPVSDGDVLKCVIEGSNFDCYINGAAWLSASDSTHTAAGKVGIGCGNYYDTFGGGDCNNAGLPSMDDFIVETAGAAPPVNDTCTCPGAGVNHEFDLSDYCVVSSCTAANITFTGTGNITCAGSWTCDDLGPLPSNQRGYVTSACSMSYN